MNRLVGLTFAALACTPASTRVPGSDLDLDDLDDLDARVARLCGTWRGRADDGTIVEERWRTSATGLTGEGVTLDARGQRLTGESFAIVVRPEGSTYRALPDGAADWTEFEQTDDRAGANPGQWVWVWSNPAHDFPSAIRYELTAGDQLRASVSGPDGNGFAWTLERIEACPD